MYVEGCGDYIGEAQPAESYADKCVCGADRRRKGSHSAIRLVAHNVWAERCKSLRPPCFLYWAPRKVGGRKIQPIPMSKSYKGTHLVSYGDRHFPGKCFPAFLISKYLCNFPIRIAALIRSGIASHCKVTPVMASQLSPKLEEAPALLAGDLRSAV